MKILIATGGSGGHIFPALETAKILRTRGHDVIFAGSLKSAITKIEEHGFRAFDIKGQGFVRTSLADLWGFGKSILAALNSATELIRREKPTVVAGFGGYGAFPLVWQAAFHQLPTLIHEQNVIPGKANRLLSYFVNRIATSFPQAQSYFPSHKTILTGCPVREMHFISDKSKTLQSLGLLTDRKTLCVLGGSQGSHRINFEILKVLAMIKQPIQVIHLSGEKDYEQLLIAYQKLGLPFYLQRFSDRMNDIYQLADVVISRAGAMTITEIAAYGLPAVLIPYPYAGGHQLANAQVLGERGISRVLEEKDLSPERLAADISALLEDGKSRSAIWLAYEGIFQRDAGDRLANQIEELRV